MRICVFLCSCVCVHLCGFDRTVLILREFEGHSYQEIADLLGISIGTVESRLFRARARFKDALARLHPDYAVQ